MVGGEPRNPRDDRPEAELLDAGDVGRLVAQAAREPVCEEHGEERDEARSEQEEKRLEARQLEHERADVPSAVVRTTSSRCGARGTRFCNETAPE